MNINIVENRKYYASENSIPCDCNYCKNYYQQILSAYPKVCAYLESMGVDVLRPLELSPYMLDENHIEYSICQYVVFGSCEEDYYHKIDDVEFGIAQSHPSTGIAEEHFVLDFYPIFLPMNLPV